jgi:hypothetical protein
MSHVLELFINLKTKNKRHEESFGVAKVTTSKLIPYCLFSIPILNAIETRGVVINFHIKIFVHMV